MAILAHSLHAIQMMFLFLRTFLQFTRSFTLSSFAESFLPVSISLLWGPVFFFFFFWKKRFFFSFACIGKNKYQNIGHMHRHRKHGGHGGHGPLDKESMGAWPPCLVRQYTHATAYTYISKTSLISSNDDTSKPGTDFEKKRSVS